jgi:hypothetical protein
MRRPLTPCADCMFYRNEFATFIISWALGTILDAIPTGWRTWSASETHFTTYLHKYNICMYGAV